MKKILIIVFSIITLGVAAQKKEMYPSADSIVISGLVNKKVAYATNGLSAMPDTALGALKILNHKGEYKFTYKNVKAVSLRSILAKSLLTVTKPKEMGSIYFVCKAMDGYTSVFSYNELFGSDTNEIFIITAYDEFTMSNMPEKPAVLTLTGGGSARVGMRGLKSIEVKKAD